jgi:hypothetical protein
MMQDYFDFINSLPLENRRHVKGYSLDEIYIIEQIYDINVDGELKEFLLFSGRCDGWLRADALYLYADKPLRWHLEFQFSNRFGVYDISGILRSDKILFISSFDCYDYFFIKTKSNDRQIYHWDPENTNSITPFNKSLSDYLLAACKHKLNHIDSYSDVIYSGDLISSHGISLVLKS